MTKKKEKTKIVGIIWSTTYTEFIGLAHGQTEFDMIEDAKQQASEHDEEHEYIIVIPQKIITLSPTQIFEFESSDGTIEDLPH